MKIDEVMKIIVNSSTYRKEIGATFQLGLPKFTMRNKELFATFHPHVEKFSNGIVSYYIPQYELELVYPFRHVVLLKNLVYSLNFNSNLVDKPACCISLGNVEANVGYIRQLFSLADEILHCRENNIEDLSALVLNYEKQYTHFTEIMGLQAIYGRCL